MSRSLIYGDSKPQWYQPLPSAAPVPRSFLAAVTAGKNASGTGDRKTSADKVTRPLDNVSRWGTILFDHRSFESLMNSFMVGATNGYRGHRYQRA